MKPHGYISPKMMPIDGRNYRHRELSYAPAELRKKRDLVFILTDRLDMVVPEFAAERGGCTCR